MFDFQPRGKTWEERATLVGRKAVLDPIGNELKNTLIDTIHRTNLEKTIRTINHGGVCLDFGCGIGRLHDFLRRYYSNYKGIDVTEEMIKKAKTVYNDEFVSFDGINIPLKDESVNTVFSVLVLQHINDKCEYEKIVRELYRILKRGGYVLFIEQVSVEKTVNDYVAPFVQNGFIKNNISLIRRGSSISSWLSSRNFMSVLPRCVIMPILQLVNSIENMLPPIKDSYNECIFVFRKDY